MIKVDFNKVELGISKKLKESIPFFDQFYALSPDACIKATLSQDLETLFLTLSHKYGITLTKDMVLRALADTIASSENSEVTNTTKENKDHD